MFQVTFGGAQAEILLAKKRESAPPDTWSKDDWKVAIRMGDALTSSDLAKINGSIMLDMSV